jgi:hypothetical protein
MIACAACHRENDPWRRHCGRCGSDLPGSCTGCGFVNRVDDRFCGGCAKVRRIGQTVLPGTIPIDIADLFVDTK